MHIHLVDATLFHAERWMDSHNEAEGCSIQLMHK